MRITKLLFLVAFLHNIYSNAQIYNFKHYNEDSGLPQLYIYTISQDKNDYLYFSTGEGLAVYNSKKMKTYNAKSGLAESFVNTHYIAKDGTIWLGHFQNGISYIRNNKVFKIKNKELINVRISCILEDANGCILVATKGKGIFIIDKLLTVTKLSTTNSDNINTLFLDKQSLFVGSEEGLSIYNYSKGFRLIQEVDFFADIKITAIKKDVFGNILVSSFSKGLTILNVANGKATILENLVTENSSNDITDIAISDSTIWAATFGSGVIKYAIHNKQYSKISVQYFGQSSGLSNQFIQSIYKDREGSIWIGTYGGGLYQLINEQFTLLNKSCGIKEEDIRSVCVDASNVLWIGTKNGLEAFDLTTSKPIASFTKSTGFVNDVVGALYLDDKNNLWIGTENNGLFYKPFSSTKITNVSKKYDVKFNSINCIKENKNHQLFIGTSEGLVVIDSKNGTSKVFTTNEGLTHNLIYNIFIDKSNRVWFACHGSGPFYYKDGEFTVFKDIDELRSYNLNSICEDKKNNLWFASEGDGVFKYNGKKFINYNVTNGLISNYCYSIIVDAQNNVWVGCKNGVSCLKDGNKQFESYSKNEGFLSTVTNLNATYYQNNNTIWYGTENGLVHYKPKNISAKKQVTKTIIESVTINDSTYIRLSDIQLPFKKYQLKFNIVGVNFYDNQKVKLRYILEGYDDKWKVIQNNLESIDYTKIEDGEYVFKIQACTPEGNWNPIFSTVSIHIALPFWKTFWFYLLVIIVFIFSVRFYSNYKTKALLERQVVLEKSVKEKTIEIRLQNEQLEYQKNELEVSNVALTDSITYAKRLQEAMLPDNISISNLENEVFIFYSPRDIVSGDFYWFYPYSEDITLIAAADCTGHGVPGAFLTMMGSTLLNKIVKDSDITEPAQILVKLDENVRESLHQINEDSTKDGMDIAICRIDKKNKLISYSGAGRPLFLVQNNVLTSYKPSYSSIGYFNEGIPKVFENVEIKANSGDMVYLFSDGVVDQFDERNRTKFMSKRLKELLVSVSDKPIENQKTEIAQTFFKWKGNNQQTDDVLLIGIKVI